MSFGIGMREESRAQQVSDYGQGSSRKEGIGKRG